MKFIRQTSAQELWKDDIKKFFVVLDEIEAIEEVEMKKRLQVAYEKSNQGKSKGGAKKTKKRKMQ